MLNLLFIFVVFSAQVPEHDRSIPSLNYWDLSGQLTLFQREVMLTDGELAKLKVPRTAFAPRIEEPLNKALLNRQRRDIATLRERTLSDLDAMVYAELRKVLSASKLESLRYAALKIKFPFAYMPFVDQEVLKFCDVANVDQAKLSKLVKEQERIFLAEKSERLAALGTLLSSALPEKSKPLFLQFAGKRLLPEQPEFNGASSKTIPIRRDMLRPLAVLSLSKNLGLSQEQFDAIQAIDEATREEKTTVFSSTKVIPEYQAEIKRIEEKARQQVELLCSPQQLLDLNHLIVEAEFSANFISPFRRQELIEFLELKPEEAVQVQSKAKECAEDMQGFEHEWNKRIFKQLLTALPNECQTKMRELFFLMLWE